MSGAPTSALEAPRRAKNAATSGRRAKPTQQKRPQQQGQPDVMPLAALSGPDMAAFWQDAAQAPGASDLVRHYAQRAMTQKANGGR